MHLIGFGLFTFTDATHTPHGDGNENVPFFIYPSKTMQLIPLTGTETAGRVRCGCPAGRCNSYPSRGRKQFAHQLIVCHRPMQLIPLTGTETLQDPASLFPIRPDATHTPHGDKNRERKRSLSLSVFFCTDMESNIFYQVIKTVDYSCRILYNINSFRK